MRAAAAGNTALGLLLRLCHCSSARGPPCSPHPAPGSKQNPSTLGGPAALFYRLKQKGFDECKAYSKAYADCCSGRVLSVVWACRGEMKALSNCMSQQ